MNKNQISENKNEFPSLLQSAEDNRRVNRSVCYLPRCVRCGDPHYQNSDYCLGCSNDIRDLRIA